MAITEQTGMVQTVLAARGYRLEMATRLMESPIDYLGSALGTIQGAKDDLVLRCGTW